MSEKIEAFLPRRWSLMETVDGLTTTFTGDLNIAEDMGGLDAAKRTFEKAFAEWRKDVAYLINLTVVLNRKSAQCEQEDGGAELAGLYRFSANRVRDWVLGGESGFKDADKQRFAKLVG